MARKSGHPFFKSVTSSNHVTTEIETRKPLADREQGTTPAAHGNQAEQAPAVEAKGA